jgi:uncharacterized protein Yka (UPF0111/DUF47 family)
MTRYILIIALIINAAACSSEEQEAPTREETTKMVTNQIKGAMAKAVAKEEPYIHSLSELAESHATVQEWEKELDRLEKKGLENLTNEEWEEYNALHKKQMVQIFKWSRSLQHHIDEAEDYHSSK